MRARLLITLLLSVLCAGFLAAPAHAAASVSVSNEFGKAEADITYATQLRLSGSGFQSIQNGHGGIYVFFGVRRGGELLYIPDSETRDNQGFQRFVSFPGGDTASAANGGIMSSSGTWSTSINVPGARFKTTNRSGKVVDVDCTKETCGVITIGAHGVKNANNETFTPVAFGNIHESQTPATSGVSPTESASPVPTSPSASTGSAEPAPATPSKQARPAVTIDPATAVVGRVLVFTGSGFTPGEQVIATLDDGVAAVGPLSAGQQGEVAGVLQLPADVESGTHVLKLVGAASGAAPTRNFPIMADPHAALAQPESSGMPGWVRYVALVAAALVLVAVSLISAFRIRALRRKGAVAHA